jgi:hypothetical protein
MYSLLIKIFLSIYFCGISFIFVLIALIFTSILRFQKVRGLPRLVWGEAPIMNNVYWSNALRKIGYKSETFTDSYCTSINERKDYGKILQEKYCFLPLHLKYYVAFIHSLFIYDVYFISANGYFLGKTFIWKLEHFFLKISRKKIVLIPFGLDAFVYHRVRSTTLIHGLLSSIPEPARNQNMIAKKLDYWCKNSDCVIPGPMGPDGFGRWDVLVPSSLTIDLHKWTISKRANQSDGTYGSVVITHAPNHRGFKGTEFVIEAVRILQSEGLKVQLILIEKLQNDEVRRILAEETDILIEQVIAPGHGLNGLEGLASGLPVISNLEDDTYMLPLRRWSYLGECPIVSASPETLADVLRKLVTRPMLRKQIAAASRAYAEKYHGFDSAQYLFSKVIDYVYGKQSSLINLYHPLLGEYNKRSPKIVHPLINSRIKD